MRHGRRRHLTGAGHPLGSPIPLGSRHIHRTGNNAKTGNPLDHTPRGGGWSMGWLSGCLTPRYEGAADRGGIPLIHSATTDYRLASAHRLVASSTANTALRSALSRI